MNAKTTPGDFISETNLRGYEDQRSVRYWSSYSDQLLTAEAEILRGIQGAFRDKPILDVGVGGGRTTSPLLRISADYLGIDYSPGMIAACRERFPGVAFKHGDAREMASFGHNRFSLVFFSFNGIDCVDHSDRFKVYAAARDALASGGYFVFSAHNLRDDRERLAKPWQLKLHDWRAARASPRDFARTLYHLLAQNISYWRLRRGQAWGQRYAILLDRGQHFRNLTHFIDPCEQVRHLEEAGFAEISVHDRRGKAWPAESPELDQIKPVHYLARKP
jgi:SAM-dependent methyltransferase